ncbi:MAG: anti-sigma factor family protein [Actinomycetota bacterium]
MKSISHERCSELLSDYVSGELASEERQRVEEHLEHCAQCSAERAGLASLSPAGTEAPGLMDDERAALRAAVRGTLGSQEPEVVPLADESDAVIVPLERKGARAGRYLGIAAMLALLAVGSLFVFRGGLGFSGGDSDAGDAAVSGGRDEDSGGGGAEGQAPEPRGRAAEEVYRRAKSLSPTYQADRGTLANDDLDRLTEQPAFERSVSSAAAIADTAGEREQAEKDPQELSMLADRASDRSLARLVTEVPDSLSAAVRECGSNALAELGGPALATYATTATLEGRDALIIGFLTGQRSLDRYALYAFEAGDCTTILTNTEGPLR